MKVTKDVKIITLATVLLFLLLLPLSNLINFSLNDDHVYYKTTNDFLHGNFVLDPYISPTFYMQGFMGAFFAKFFSLQKLPILTLFLSAASFYIFCLILLKFLNQKLLPTLLLGSLYFFNSFNIYTTLGYMTAQYFLIFMMASIYFYLFYLKNNKTENLILSLVFAVFGLFVRQVALVITLSIVLHQLYLKKYKTAFYSFLVLFISYAFYRYALPLTTRTLELEPQIHHFLNFDYVYALVYGTLIILSAFTLPLALYVIDIKKLLQNKKSLLLFLVLTIFLFFSLNNLFRPESVSWGEFPYFENTFERTGFYPRGISGTKYYFAGNFKLYIYWDLVAKIVTATILSYLVIAKKNVINFYSIFAVVYIGLMITTETFYDRYNLILIPIVILFFIEYSEVKLNRLHLVSISLFAVFLIFLNYQFSLDFILANKYVWNRAQEIAEINKLPRNQIQATNAWKLSNKNDKKNYVYDFSYDSPEVNKIYANNYTLVEKQKITFPGSIFVQPYIYLYKINN